MARRPEWAATDAEIAAMWDMTQPAASSEMVGITSYVSVPTHFLTLLICEAAHHTGRHPVGGAEFNALHRLGHAARRLIELERLTPLGGVGPADSASSEDPS